MPTPSQLAILTFRDSSIAGAKNAGAVASLLRFLTDHDLTATWATDRPVTWPHAAMVAADQPRQELALLADAWSPSNAARAAFGTELARRVLESRASGLALSTLYVSGTTVPHRDLLVKYGITAVGPLSADEAARPASGMLRLFRADGGKAAHGPTNASQVRSLRWGLWELPEAIDLLHVGAKRARRALRQAAAGGIAHLTVDLAALEAGGRRALARLDDVLRLMVELRERGQLQSRTAAGAVARLTRRRVTIAACSILRRAA
ncbi:MAG: hypothetical protein HYX69_06585 [Planctomycetia bacterium]|nr:hypothetical protein [Planctomycetia bacterium]